MNKPYELRDLKLGIDMLSGETSIPQGAARDVVNIDLDRYGNWQRRRGYALSTALTDGHSLWSSPSGRGLFVCQGTTFCKITPPSLITPLALLRSADPVDYSEHNGAIYFSNETSIGWIPADSDNVWSLGVFTPDAPTVTPGPNGTLRPGRYTLAFTFVNRRGEESGSSDYVFSNLTAPGGFVLTALPQIPFGWQLRVYLSPPNGEDLFLAASVPSGMPQYVVGDNAQLKPLETAALVPMPPGKIIRTLAGRTYTAKGKVLAYSEAFRFGLTRLHHNFITMPDEITIVEPTPLGVFVGAGGAVWFIDGDPSKAAIRQVSAARAVERSSTLVDGKHFDQKLSQGQPVAVWLSSEGYVMGLPDGNVVALQSNRIHLDGEFTGRTTFALRDGVKQVITPYSAKGAVAQLDSSYLLTEDGDKFLSESGTDFFVLEA